MESLNDPVKLGGDAWLELQAFKNRQLHRREKLNRHKDLINGLDQAKKRTSLGDVVNPSGLNHVAGSSTPLGAGSQKNNLQQSVLDEKLKRSRLDDDNTSLQDEHSRNTLDQSGTILSHHNTFEIDHINNEINQPNLELIESLLLLKLCDVALKLPIDSRVLLRYIWRIKGLEATSQSLVENFLQKFAHQELISIEEPSSRRLLGRLSSIDEEDDGQLIYVTAADHTKLVEIDQSLTSHEPIKSILASLESNETDNHRLEADRLDQTGSAIEVNSRASVPIQTVKRNDHHSNNHDLVYNSSNSSHKFNHIKSQASKDLSNRAKPSTDDLESLLSLSSTKERESKKLGEELLELLSKPTAKERNLMERFRSADGYQVQEFCAKGTKGECIRDNKNGVPCTKLHFKKIIAKHTEESLGDCSFLNTCFHMDSCKYVHYEVDYDEDSCNEGRGHFKRPRHPTSGPKQIKLDRPDGSARQTTSSSRLRDSNNNAKQKVDDASSTPIINSIDTPSEIIPSYESSHSRRFKTILYPPQWIQCDLRFFDMTLLGKFSVVMADPPWDIHMELPYGTMSDDEMRKLNIPSLQDEGVIFLWVTGRAMELGRECLSLWGYERCDEIIWVKTNQLQRIIRTGRTGHWLNHGKEHCLVGVKGNPKDINRGLDCDVIVAEVRATSHKPDEIYGIIERLSPGTRKIELFGRPHNVQPNWITLGNQLNGVQIMDPDLVDGFKRLNLPHRSDGPI